jgi:ABC-type uncharacterized transport system permease subunit
MKPDFIILRPMTISAAEAGLAATSNVAAAIRRCLAFVMLLLRS